MITYILKSSLSLLLLFGLYWFLLRKEKLFVFNRYFLIFSILFSLVIPLISIPVNVRINESQSNVITTLNSNLTAFRPERNGVTVIADQPFNKDVSDVEAIPTRTKLIQILIILYFTGIIIMLFRFLLNIFYISRQKRLSEVITYSEQKLALVDHQITPFSFLNTIFVSKHDYLNNKIAKDILAHEIEHIRQSHSFDIIFLELIQIIYWFNPILILYNRAIRVNHEYLADNGVIRESPDIKSYANTLLSFISCRSKIPLTSGFNPSFYKRRLVMMAKNKSKNISNRIRITSTLSLAAAIFFILSCKPSNSQPSKIKGITDGLEGMQIKSLKDIDGNVYKTVTISNHVWMAENLKTTKYNDGTDIPLVTDDKQWQKYEPSYCWYNNDVAENKDIYGALYNWYVANTNKLCPIGWHVPNFDELKSLVIFSAIDSLSGVNLKKLVFFIGKTRTKERQTRQDSQHSLEVSVYIQESSNSLVKRVHGGAPVRRMSILDMGGYCPITMAGYIFNRQVSGMDFLYGV